MPDPAPTRLPDILGRYQQEILDDWTRLQQESLARRRDVISDQELKRQSTAFLQGIRASATSSGHGQ